MFNIKSYFIFRVNRKYFDAIKTPFTVVSGPTDKEWVQVYRGIAAGLGKYNVSFETCVKDGDQTVTTFKQAFEAFDNKEIFRGMQLIGEALMDVYKAFEACGETDIAKALEKLAIDFIKCTESMYFINFL
jgi:6,7-dimethyl-8-ribityllumazine synthase